MSALPANPLSFLPCGMPTANSGRGVAQCKNTDGGSSFQARWRPVKAKTLLDCHWRQTMSAKHAGTGVLAVHKIGAVESQ
ncbi:hypothetical protein I7I50_04218 [Histoplasma capsulatum G186AR]|uniref:Uncharacterized protein n=1 Tax=Ajellomyces capsulatus TaxID=5037 RepID=A0A8H8CYU6_AJECA|nr:hypothetical protein I7I52_05126 [Histoplasma capsulatum]QSS75170.1 hypothetical protein I7I50_04218 [Histoplasma capsulatum G186AR]